MTEVPEYDPTPVPADTAPEHLEAIATTDAVLELPPEQSGFGEGNVGEVLLDIDGLSKSFGSVRANRDISMHVRRGEIVALLGENGAGKSTLVNQIFGLITPDTGTVSVQGDATPIKDPRDAIRRGIGMVHQHFQLVPVMTVAENMMLGHEPTKAGGRSTSPAPARWCARCRPSTGCRSTPTPRSRTCRSAPSSASRSSRRSRAGSTCSSSTSRPRC